MKQIKAYIRRVRSVAVIEALGDVGFNNVSLLDVKDTLRPLNESELAYSSDVGVVISEMQLSLVCEDKEVDQVASIIRKAAHIGEGISGWVYVTPIEQAMLIDGQSA